MKFKGSYFSRMRAFAVRFYPQILIAVALVLLVFAFTSRSYDQKMRREVARVERALHKRQKVMERYALQAMNSDETWIDFEGLPDDMVIYCYQADSLQCWKHEFPVSNDEIKAYTFSYRLQYTSNRNLYATPLAYVGVKEKYVNLGSSWYIVNTQISSDFQKKVVTGILVRTEYPGGILKNTVNSHLRLSEGYTTLGIDTDDSAVVYGLEGEPLFSIVTDSPSAYVPTSAPMVWTALFLLFVAFIATYYKKRNWLSFWMALGSLLLIRIISALYVANSANPGTIFSPIYYADNSLFNSLGNLLINSFLLSVGVYCTFLVRNRIYRCMRGWHTVTARVLQIGMAVLTLAFAVHIYVSLRSLILNSNIVLEPFRIGHISLYSVLCYLSYALLLLAFAQLIQMTLLFSGRYRHVNVFSWRNILIYIAAASCFFVVVVSLAGLKRETESNYLNTSKLAMDRDLSLELSLIDLEPSIQNDNFISVLSNVNAIEMIRNRLLDRYFFRDVTRRYNVLITSCSPEHFLELGSGAEPVGCFQFYDDLVKEHGTPLYPGSVFFFLNNDGKTKYLGCFTYVNKQDHTVSRLYIMLEAKYQSSISSNPLDLIDSQTNAGTNMPRYYSYAKYLNGRLVTRDGKYDYPVLTEIGTDREYTTVKKNGYLHFVNHISDDELIVLSRPRKPLFSYVVSFSYLYIFFGLVLLTFSASRRKTRLITLPKHTFKRKITLLTTGLIIFSLIVMGIGSVVYVVVLNRGHINENVEAKIASVQNSLSEHCRYAGIYTTLDNNEFKTTVDNLAEVMQCDINIYSPAGLLQHSTKPELFEQFILGTRMDNEAFHNIRHLNAPSHIAIGKVAGLNYLSIFAPLFNAEGDMVAIINVPYMNRDVDVEEETVSTVSAVVNIYLLLLIVAIAFATFLSNSMSRPLAEIKKKIDQLALPGNRNRHIKYKNTNDELGVLIESYNKMVDDLDESTRRLAQNEREQAWKEMARQIAHEIKNPLTPMRLSIQYLMKLKQENVPGWEDKLERISRSLLEQIDTLSNTANEFSSFAKFFSEPVAEFNIDEVIREQAVLFDNRENISIRYVQNALNPVMQGRRSQISRVLVNLLTNSIQAIENAGLQDGHIKITLEEERDGEERIYAVSVDDNGPGVSDENLERLFTPNFTTKSGGTGLGLAICKSIVEKSHGTIEYSRSELGGARFTMKFRV